VTKGGVLFLSAASLPDALILYYAWCQGGCL